MNHLAEIFSDKVDLSSHITKADIKNILLLDTSSSTLKSNLAILNTEVDKLDIKNSIPVPVELRKLRDAVKIMLLKKLSMINNIE